MKIFSAHNISKNVYDQQILQNIELDLNKGDIAWIEAKQGSGKTLLANIFANVETADQGQMQWYTNQGRKFGAIFDVAAIISNLSVAQNLALAMDHFSGPQPADLRRQIIQKTLDEWNLGHTLDWRPVALSKSQLMQIAVIRAMLAEPNVLIWDDAFEAFDAEIQNTILQKMLAQLQRGCGLIFFSRRPPFFEHDSLRLLRLMNGRLVA
jgi:ABC-type sulfate/molybdate transport systems ATPase subunit